MARTVGLNLINVCRFVIDRFGMSGWAHVLATLPPADRDVVARIKEGDWCDEHILFRVLRSVSRTGGTEDLKLLAELGRANAERDIRGAMRFFFRFANPSYVLEKAAEYWGRFHDTGQWEVQRQPAGAIGILTGFDLEDRTFCAVVTGYIERMFELVGAEGVRAEHTRCRARLDEACEFVVRWNP
jgi:hypothetical protein